jgi:6-pyruvoyltetrahydropterin/6-carboxytetrahydropterin synthase
MRVIGPRVEAGAGAREQGTMDKPIITISQDFAFEAAHCMPKQTRFPGQTQIHGHSFTVKMELKGETNADDGTIENFELAVAKFRDLVMKLDHCFLNDIPGLDNPTMENIGLWLLNRGLQIDPRLNAVTVGRPTLGQLCRIQIPEKRASLKDQEPVSFRTSARAA